MDELAQCYNVLPQLDINNTIDHRHEGDEEWFLENEKMVTQFCRKLAGERPLKDIRDEYNYPKKKCIKDECSRLLEAFTMKSRRGFAIQRLMNAMRQAHADCWFFFLAEDGIRDHCVTGVQTCALPIWADRAGPHQLPQHGRGICVPLLMRHRDSSGTSRPHVARERQTQGRFGCEVLDLPGQLRGVPQIGRASCRERV